MYDKLPLIIGLIVILYARIIIDYTIGWRKIMSPNKSKNITPKNTFSIIIPFRNEALNLTNLLNDLSKIDYPKNLFEITLINDNSEDNSLKIINQYINDNKLNIIVLQSNNGKKSAIKKGLKTANNEYILSLDADCRIPKNILMEYDLILQTKKSKIISGPVAFINGKGIWSKFMELEFMSLVASGAGAIGVSKPIMANAANLLFERKMAINAQEEIYDNRISSGDDIFLIQYASKNFGKSSIQFLKSTDAIVQTPAPASFIKWVNQRLRWTAKAKYYKINHTSLTASIVLLFNLIIVICFINGFFDTNYFIITAASIFIKTIIDLRLLYLASKFFNNKNLIKYLPVFEIFYPFYIVLISLMAVFYSGKWKGRN